MPQKLRVPTGPIGPSSSSFLPFGPPGANGPAGPPSPRERLRMAMVAVRDDMDEEDIVTMWREVLTKDVMDS